MLPAAGMADLDIDIQPLRALDNVYSGTTVFKRS